MHVWARGGTFLLALVAVSASSMSLQEAVRLGLENNPDVRAARLDTEAAKTEVKVARNGYYPTLSASAGPRNFGFGDVTYDVTASQMLYDWGRTGGRVDNARAVERQAGADARARMDDAALDIVEIYLDLLLSERLISADRRFTDALASVAEMTEARASGGYSDLAEPERARLELARARERTAQDEGTQRDLRNQFLLLVGTPPADLQEPTIHDAQIQQASATMDEAVAQAPAYQKSVEDTRIAQARVREARASLRPQLNLEANTLRRDLGGRAQSDTMVGLRFRMDTMQGLSSFQRSDAARQRLESARWRTGAVEREIRRDVQNMLDQIELLDARLETLDRQVESSGTLGGLYQEQFQVGRRDVIDLLNVQRESFEAERQAATVRIELLRLRYRIGARLGFLDRLVDGPAA